jgi:hypothetical protein
MSVRFIRKCQFPRAPSRARENVWPSVGRFQGHRILIFTHAFVSSVTISCMCLPCHTVDHFSLCCTVPVRLAERWDAFKLLAQILSKAIKCILLKSPTTSFALPKYTSCSRLRILSSISSTILPMLATCEVSSSTAMSASTWRTMFPERSSPPRASLSVPRERMTVDVSL